MLRTVRLGKKMNSILFSKFLERFFLVAFLGVFSLVSCVNSGLEYDLRPIKILEVIGNTLRVVSFMPGKDATGVSVTAMVSATFNRDMDGSTITAATFTVEDGGGPITGLVTYDVPSRTATFSLIAPMEFAYLTEYTVTVFPMVRDFEGNYMQKEVQWRFTTMDVATPTYTVSFNSTGGSAVAPQTVAEGGLVSEPANPTRDEYAFEGWYTDNTYTVRWDFTTNTVTSDRTLWANWLPGTAGLAYTNVGAHYTVNAGTVTAGNVVIPDTHAGLPVTEIEPNGFQNLPGLTGVMVPTSVTIIGNQAFLNCTGIVDVTIGGGVTTIGDGAFSQCNGIASLTIGDGVATIGASAFSHCAALTSVTIPDSVTTIEDSAFQYCTNLSALTIGSSVGTIGNFAFWYCDSLTSVTIPASVHTIGASVLRSCPNLTTVYALPPTPPVAGAAMFTDTLVPMSGAIYVPPGCADVYKAAGGWSTYDTVIVEMP